MTPLRYSTVAQAGQHILQHKTPIEAITKLGQIARQVFVLDSVIAAVNRPFDIADHRINPRKSLQRYTRRAAPGDDSRMLTARFGHRRKARPAHPKPRGYRRSDGAWPTWRSLWNESRRRHS